VVPFSLSECICFGWQLLEGFFFLHSVYMRMLLAGTSGVMTVIRSIANNHEHLSRLGTWCWAQTGHTGKASI